VTEAAITSRLFENGKLGNVTVKGDRNTDLLFQTYLRRRQYPN
jgi:hypothetical protein